MKGSRRGRISWSEAKEVAITAAEYFGSTFAIAYFGYQIAHPLADQSIAHFLLDPLRPSFGIASVTFAGVAVNFLRKMASNTEAGK